MRGVYERFRERGAEVVVIAFEPVERLTIYRQQQGWPFPITTDPDRAIYRRFGLESGSWTQIIRPSVAWSYLRLLVSGRRLRRPSPGVDLQQLGGDFVIDPDQTVRYARRSMAPDDRPDPQELLEALDRSTGQPS